MATPVKLNTANKWKNISRKESGRTIFTWYIFSNGARLYRDHIFSDPPSSEVYVEQLDGTRKYITDVEPFFAQYGDDHVFFKSQNAKNLAKLRESGANIIGNSDAALISEHAKYWLVYNMFANLTVVILPDNAFNFYPSGYFVTSGPDQKNVYQHWNNEYTCKPATARYNARFIHKGFAFQHFDGYLRGIDDVSAGIRMNSFRDMFIYNNRMVMMNFEHSYGCDDAGKLQLLPGSVAEIIVIDIDGNKLSEIYRGTLHLPTKKVRDQIQFIGMDATGIFAHDHRKLYKFDCNLL